MPVSAKKSCKQLVSCRHLKAGKEGFSYIDRINFVYISYMQNIRTICDQYKNDIRTI